jgi:carboxypeptidase C (cathepsin A)
MIRILLASLLVASPIAAQQPPLAPVTLTAPIVTRHSGTFNGKRVAYEARVESYTTSADARLVTISYLATAQPRAAERPVVFIFNGGPIAASSTLHMGAFGPKRVAIPDDITLPPDRFRFVDNPYTLLDVADLVFFDPAGTGFSRMGDPARQKGQFSVVADARQLSDLVLAWSKAHGRTASPKYLVGESYGTVRAPETAAQLHDAGMPLDGVVLFGQAVNILEYAQRKNNVMSYVVSLPTLAATAWSHNKAERRGRSFDRFTDDARAFAGGDLLRVLYLGARAGEADRQRVAKELAAFTGVPAATWLTRDFKISKVEYQQLLLPGMRLATNDARYMGPADGPDPFGVVGDAYQANFQRYLSTDLGAGQLGEYRFLLSAGGLNDWDWGPNRSPFGDWDYSARLGHAFASPRFRVFVANGWTDTQTTVGAMELMVAQSGWPRERVRTATYVGGHMAYTVEASLKRFTDDVRALVTRQW